MDLSAIIDGRNLDDFLLTCRAQATIDYLLYSITRVFPELANAVSIALNSTIPSIVPVPNAPIVNLTQISISGT